MQVSDTVIIAQMSPSHRQISHASTFGAEPPPPRGEAPSNVDHVCVFTLNPKAITAPPFFRGLSRALYFLFL